jgi:phenylalanyl-tRNA synthetase beta chain
MEYSLSTLNNKSNFSTLSLNETINKLNLVGFEVDEVSFEKSNSSSEDIKFLLKNPANRDDLFIENLFLSELGIIFLLEIYEIWNLLKTKYSFVLKQKYLNNKNYTVQAIEGNNSDVIKYIIKIDNFSNITSPSWITKKLKKRGVKVTNTFEDILELVSLEWGYKFKYYFAEKDNINEVFKLEKLTNVELLKTNDNLIPAGSIVLKNQFDEIKTVLGLETVSTSSSSSSIYIETTFYDIHENKLGLTANNTKLSFRNLRKNYLSNFKFAIQRLLSLIELLNIGTISKKIHILNNHTTKLKEFRLLKLEKQLLINVLNLEKVNSHFFNENGLKIVSETQAYLYIQIPIFRTDLTRPIDLVEEYSRFIGYANFPEILPLKELKYSANSQKSIEYIKTFFVNHNFNEVYTNPLQENNLEENTLNLFNPLNSELSSLRKDIVMNFLTILRSNLNSNINNNNLFEIGRVFKLKNGKIIEQEKLAGLFQDSLNMPTNLEWFIKKGFLENFVSHFGYKTLNVEKWSQPQSAFHPTKSIIIKHNNKILGFFGEINPKLKEFKQLKSKVYLFEFNLIHFKSWKLNSPIPIYKEYSKYPTVQKDISVLISKHVNFYTLKQSIEQNITDLKTVHFFDIYVDEKFINSNIKLGIRLEFQSTQGTLTTEIIEEKMITLRELLSKTFNVVFQD